MSATPIERVAVLSLHSHRDRSFLDDRILALVAGDLRAMGVEAELVASVIESDASVDALAGALAGFAAQDLGPTEGARSFDAIVFERVWSRAHVERLRALLPGKVFVSCEGEHALPDPPAEYVCRGDLRDSVVALFSYLRGEAKGLPRDVLAREAEGWREGLVRVPSRPRVFSPVLRPRWVGAPGGTTTFSIEGNAGCPYRTDARDNPLYAGARIPEGLGRGCAFCTTGNHSESAPPDETADKVLEQLRYVRAHAPELDRLVLKDQSPFGWLTEVIERCVAEGLRGFTLLLETRVDWFLKNERRVERALALAEQGDIKIAPFLIGIESFSQAELDRFNKGTRAEDNERFLERFGAWSARYRSFDPTQASFGFVLLTPWTTKEDLRINLEAVERTGLDARRGHLLVSRARLYPDTALYYLAERDGLLEDAPLERAADSSRRYGYFPARGWRFRDPFAARFASLAAELTERLEGRDQVSLWRALLDALERDPAAGAQDVLARMEAPSQSIMRSRLAKLVSPLAMDRPFARGWRFGEVSMHHGRVRLQLVHEREPDVEVAIVPRDGKRSFARSRHYAIRHAGAELSAAQEQALRTVCDAIVRNDPVPS